MSIKSTIAFESFEKNANSGFSGSDFLTIFQKIQNFLFTLPCELFRNVFLAWTTSEDPTNKKLSSKVSHHCLLGDELLVE